VYIGVDPATARRRYRSMTVRGNRGEAERELAAMVASVRSGRAVGVRSPVSELLEAWFAVASTGWAPTTTRQTRSVLDRYLHRQLGGLAVGEVTPAIIDAVYADLRRQGGVGDARSRRGLWLVFTRCCGRRSGRRCGGAGSGTTRPRAHRIVATTGEHRPPTPDEVRTLLEYLRGRDEQLQLLVMLAAVTGARRAQLLGLRWHNVQLDNRRVSFCAGGSGFPAMPPDRRTRQLAEADASVAAIEAGLRTSDAPWVTARRSSTPRAGRRPIVEPRL
jgi:integrase